MTEESVDVRIRVYGFTDAVENGGILSVSVSPDLAPGVAEVKAFLAEKGCDFPYVLYLNDLFVPELLKDSESPALKAGDEFTVFPIFSGG